MGVQGTRQAPGRFLSDIRELPRPGELPPQRGAPCCEVFKQVGSSGLPWKEAGPGVGGPFLPNFNVSVWGWQAQCPLQMNG